MFFLMVVESSFIPFPSELVIPPAAFLAARGEMDIWIVILMGVLGSLVGAFVNYYLALFLGRPVVYNLVSHRWAKWFLLSKAKVERAEAYFLKNGAISTFVGRLIPVIRQLVSLPAGFVKMNPLSFAAFTTLGAGIWVAFLAFVGYFFGMDGGGQAFLYVKYGLLVAGLVVLAIFIWARRRKRRRELAVD